MDGLFDACAINRDAPQSAASERRTLLRVGACAAFMMCRILADPKRTPYTAIDFLDFQRTEGIRPVAPQFIFKIKGLI
jgi:hypothetical protein